jgi:hypothetical protein
LLEDTRGSDHLQTTPHHIAFIIKAPRASDKILKIKGVGKQTAFEE